MDAFVTRKKRDADQPRRTGGRQGDQRDSGDDDLPTEVRLAMLASLLDGDVDPDVLLDVLLAHDGSVAAAAEALQSRQDYTQRKRPHRGSGGGVGKQTSLRAYASVEKQQQREDLPYSSSLLSAVLSRRGRTVVLYDVADVAAHTPCTLVHNFLPPETANALLHEMLAEASTFATPHFQLFGRAVMSPHTMGFFVDGGLATNSHGAYRYNGAALTDVRVSPPQLAAVRDVVQAAVEAAVQQRITRCYPGGRKLRHQHPGPWQPNAAFVNCYDGGHQSVGWHSDQLTYLGPRAVIGSLSLGVARQFRVRRVVPEESLDAHGDAAGQISIHLPHNSLLVMHADMQEQWKHCIASAAAIDPHPIAGNKRINITYRYYRPEFHPRHTPRCHCGIPTVLRVVQKKRENYGRYFWMCHANNIPDQQGCTFFEWADFDDDGNPIWKHNRPSRPTVSTTDINKNQ